MTVEQLRLWLKIHWTMIRSKLLDGGCQPCAVRRVAKPKPVGRGERILGIPTVLDRLIQQAVAQVLRLVFDPHFLENSYGFLPGRSAVHAVRKARDTYCENDKDPWIKMPQLSKIPVVAS